MTWCKLPSDTLNDYENVNGAILGEICVVSAVAEILRGPSFVVPLRQLLIVVVQIRLHCEIVADVDSRRVCIIPVVGVN